MIHSIIDGLRNPPGWILLVIVSLLTVHVLRFILDRLGKQITTLEIIEIVVVIGLVYLTIDVYFIENLDRSNLAWHRQPIVMLSALLLFSIWSGILLIYDRKIPRG